MTVTSGETTATPTPLRRLLAIAVSLTILVSTGCSQLRLPAIDPTGSCLFAPKPVTTTLALPGSGGEGCVCTDRLKGFCGGIGDHFKKPFTTSDPAWVEPVTPPPCPAPSAPVGISNEPCVPGPGCSGSCQTGPPAVLYGCEIDNQDPKRLAKLAKKGKRGCILLSPNKIVAPVGGEVVLLSGICGTDGYLQVNQPLEWMLTPDSVGTFIEVGDDAPGLLHKLAGSRERPKKIDADFARGLTSTKRMLITRGNHNPRDDVQLEKGQTWITLSSPSEGTSRVTVLAPESECWDQRKATATIYWVDANWQFPAPQMVAAGQPVELTTRVTRSEGSLPARGWKVRYEILQPELATFGVAGGSSVTEAIVDDSGNASVRLIPIPGTSGTATINMQVIRPGGLTDNLPALTLGSGQTFVTWSAPQLAIRAGAPAVATFDTPVQVVANVSNPGDQPARNVVVTVRLPAGTRVTNADSFAQVLPGAVVWEIGEIPAQTQLDLLMEVASQSPVNLAFQARADGLVAEDTVRIDVFRPSLSMTVTPVVDRVEAGQPVRFNVDVTNTGDRPLQNVSLTATGDPEMIHESGQRTVRKPRETGPLQPGETWGVDAVFTPTASGRRCVAFVATADGQQRADVDGCVTAINPVPQAPSLSATLEARPQVVVGEPTLVRARVANRGLGTASNVTITMDYPPQLRLLQATEGSDQSLVSQNTVAWNVPRIDPGQEAVLEARFEPVAPIANAQIRLGSESLEGVRTNADLVIQIAPNAAAPAVEPPPSMPAEQPAPRIPGGAAPRPLEGQPPATNPAAPAGPAVSGRLQARLYAWNNPVRVNDSIRYSLRIVNDSTEVDSQVGIQFRLPNGVQLRSVNPRTNPELGERRIDEGVVSLAYIRTMQPGETIDYDIVLSSNQPQTFDMEVQIRSTRSLNAIVERVTTTVTP
ncbi:MAG: hypothetical protein AAGG48_20840 [Planctomycetota bacterium]